MQHATAVAAVRSAGPFKPGAQPAHIIRVPFPPPDRLTMPPSSILVAAFNLVLATGAAAQPAASRTIVAVAPGLFEFHSGPWYDLHHMLYAQARIRVGLDSTRPAVRRSVSDTAGFGTLGESERAAWRAAQAYYEQHLARLDATFERRMIDLDNRLAAAADAPALDGAGIPSDLARVLESAAPVHRRLWWPAHDAANRAWVADVMPLLRDHGTAIAEVLTDRFRATWPGSPIRVDLAAYGKGGGAYTTNRPSHINMPSLDEGYRGTRSLEMLFHESLHTLDGSLARALRSAASARGTRVPGDLRHVLIFYSAGEATRQRIPDHVPYPEWAGLWERVTAWRALLPTVRSAWEPYLERRTSFDEAVAALVAR